MSKFFLRCIFFLFFFLYRMGHLFRFMALRAGCWHSSAQECHHGTDLCSLHSRQLSLVLYVLLHLVCNGISEASFVHAVLREHWEKSAFQKQATRGYWMAFMPSNHFYTEKGELNLLSVLFFSGQVPRNKT